MDDAVDLAQNRPLWRLMSTFGATQYALLVVLARNDDDDDPIEHKLSAVKTLMERSQCLASDVVNRKREGGPHKRRPT